ncbi:MAG: histidine--tRNA ligase family protein [Chloroflexi bacterium]|nr:histidine--tRNA ligase family protein [Chloroflexota bacterium]
MDLPEIYSIPGTRDALPPQRAVERALEARLQSVFSRYGYEPIDTPILEPTELFLRKSGEAIASQMYSFTYWNRDLCLRPEFTASVIRAYVNHMQDRALPLRVQYAGPTFRYERPHETRHRQLTEIGAECIGAAGPGADAEILAMALSGLEAAGVRNAHFVVGHLGAVLGLLAQLGMDVRAQSLVVSEMEGLAQSPNDSAEVVERLATMLAGGTESDQLSQGALAELLQSQGAEAAAEITTTLFERANLSLDGGSRSPEEIVARLLKKTSRPDPVPGLRRASHFIRELRHLAGPPDQAVPALRRFLGEQGLDDAPVRDVERALECFGSYFDEAPPLVVDLSRARGLRYYTGLIFEVYAEDGARLAGGGRYDDLVRSLGGHETVPACGFSYVLEGLLAAATPKAKEQSARSSVDLVVAPIADSDYGAAAHSAALLRRAGLSVEMDVGFGGVNVNLRSATQRSIPLVLIVDELKVGAGSATLHDVRASSEATIPSAELVNAVLERLKAYA